MTQGPWWIVGPLLGALVVLMLWATNKPLGALGGYVDATASIRGARPTWRVAFLGGIAIGGLVFALATRTFASGFANAPLLARIGSVPGAALVALAGGVAIGFGARTASGCTSGHGISGTALGSPASFVACGTFMVVAVVTAHVVAWLSGGA